MKKLLCLLLCLLLTGCTASTMADQTDGASRSATAGQPETAEPLKVAVIDTGFSSAIPVENVAPGTNYLKPEAGTEDTYGHGTAVASLILEQAPKAVLVPMVSTMYERGKLSHVTAPVLAQMLRDAVDKYGCSLINVSAGLAADDPELRAAVDYCGEKGVLIIAAAGNDYETNPQTAYYPAAYAGVLAVGALNEDRNGVASFSQRGDWVTLYAPGVNISVMTLSGGSREEIGTSYAAAQICGAAAALLEAEPNMDAGQLKAALLEETVRLPGGESAWVGLAKEEAQP